MQPNELLAHIDTLRDTLRFAQRNNRQQFASELAVKTEVMNQLACNALDSITSDSVKSRTISMHDLDRYHNAKRELGVTQEKAAIALNADIVQRFQTLSVEKSSQLVRDMLYNLATMPRTADLTDGPYRADDDPLFSEAN